MDGPDEGCQASNPSRVQCCNWRCGRVFTRSWREVRPAHLWIRLLDSTEQLPHRRMSDDDSNHQSSRYWVFDALTTGAQRACGAMLSIWSPCYIRTHCLRVAIPGKQLISDCCSLWLFICVSDSSCCRHLHTSFPLGEGYAVEVTLNLMDDIKRQPYAVRAAVTQGTKDVESSVFRERVIHSLNGSAAHLLTASTVPTMAQTVMSGTPTSPFHTVVHTPTDSRRYHPEKKKACRLHR